MVQNAYLEDAERASDALLDPGSRAKTIPIIVASANSKRSDLSDLSSAERAWLGSSGFRFGAGEFVLLSDDKGDVSKVVCGGKDDIVGEGANTDGAFSFATLASQLPDGNYQVAGDVADEPLIALAWVLGAYSYQRYRAVAESRHCRLKPSTTVDFDLVNTLASSVYLGRDLINTPANDLGPDELEAIARALAKAHKARVSVVTGDDLISENFPMIHAVGRASSRAPRLVDLSWGNKSHPTVTLVGKGIVFDTGGLNLKPGNSMALMKKDMGGAATVLSLASMIMRAKLPVRLRVLLPIAENCISSNAYRPGDVLVSRNGMTVEIGNTDAEGRLVLADALALADEEQPDHLFCFATLTGAARVALGPDLPPVYATDDTIADALLQEGLIAKDPLWRMPFWGPYDLTLQSAVADVSHISTGPFAGSITAALFLKRFVKRAQSFAHIDLYGWVPVAKPGFPKGGEPQGARAVFHCLQRKYGS